MTRVISQKTINRAIRLGLYVVGQHDEQGQWAVRFGPVLTREEREQMNGKEALSVRLYTEEQAVKWLDYFEQY